MSDGVSAAAESNKIGGGIAETIESGAIGGGMAETIETGKTEELGEELFNLFAQVLNSPKNRKFLDSIRGEYGVLWYLWKVENNVSAGDLKEQLHVVPGRMTDILTSLESKKLIVRTKDEIDRRVVHVTITPEGIEEVQKRREDIHEDYKGLFSAFKYEEAKEFIRLLRVMMTYKS
ncbi:MAG: MarR family transcriptional regulator [Eubacteriales bacterium]|nr:MarR family transcriptional regulator [Eubacteriales bacterium]